MGTELSRHFKCARRGQRLGDLNFNLRDGKLHNYIAFDHTDNVAFGRPILVNDMFEHAYHMDYGANAAMYIDAFMQNINWDECNRRLEEAKKMNASLRG